MFNQLYRIGFVFMLCCTLACEPEVVETDTNHFSDRVKLALRSAGNELLLAHQDSTSLVLPVKEIASKRFELSFERTLSIHPDSLVHIIERNLNRADLPGDYRVGVVACEAKEISYSFEMSTDPDKRMLPCSGRNLPAQCYVIDILFLEATDANHRVNASNLPPYVFFLLACIPLAFVVYNKRKKVTESSTSNNFIPLGTFQFYPEQQQLVRNKEGIALSNKECELLVIFVSNLNSVVKREELSKKVWEDHGVVVGRSLDTYVSKLRKKIQADPNIKLTNVHGVGYKLEVVS